MQRLQLLLAVLPAFFAMPSLGWAESSLDDGLATVRNITIRRMNIFDEPTTSEYIAPRLINRFHYTTRESVIRREIWFATGYLIDNDDLEELERNIRALDLFARVDVTVELVASDTDTAPIVDILVSTTDRLSIVASTGGSFLGGVGEVSTTVGEKNLFGLGHSIEFGYKQNTEGEHLGAFGYDNIRLASGDVVVGVRLGQTEEGGFGGIKIRNEFDNSDDKLSWAIEFDQLETLIDFYEDGESIVEVPRKTDTLSLSRIYRHGDQTGFWRYGAVAEYKVSNYADAIGEQTGSIAIPEDSEEVFAGGLLGYNAIHSRAKVNWFDTLNYEQDLSFGYGAAVTIGASRIKNETSESTRPVVFLNYWWRNRLSADEYVNATTETAYVIDQKQSDSWNTSVAARFYSTRINKLTLASSLRYRTGFNGSGLPALQSLGENNGLRGYPAQEFNGEQSLLLNLESRIKLPVEILTFQLGAVVFIDSGWVGDRGQDSFFDEAHVSAGFGTRIGSSELLGSAVIRLDVAYPFDDNPVRNYQPLVSLSLGQVFEFN